MRALLARVGRCLDLVGPSHAAAILALLWLLSMAVVWVAVGGGR
ncbi:hypothetical protein ACGF0J_21770 [Nonomuraea sp. NPDC047897]